MKKTLYFMTLFALVAVGAVSVFFSNTVSAQRDVTVSRGGAATTEMVARALDFGSGSNFAVFANKGISDNGSSRVTGNVAAVRGTNVNGFRRNAEVDTNQAGNDLASSFSILRNLPATMVTDSNLSGKTFGPGVYSLASARLEGDMVLDANNDPNAIFVFKVAGSLNTEKGSSITLANKAYAANVFFVADDSVNVAEGTDFNGSIFAGNNVTVDNAKVTGRAISVNGTVNLNAAEVVQQTGFLEICKRVDPATDPAAQATATSATGTTALIGRVFTFTAGGQTFTVVAGSTNGALNCSAPQQVASGPLTVTELQTTTNTAGGVTRTGGFQIVSVTGGAQAGSNVVTSTNIPAGTAVVNVGAAATVAGETQIIVTNRAANTGTIEICKIAANALGTAPGTLDVNTNAALGTLFSFTINGVNNANGTPVVFQAPLGTATNPGCTGPLLITLPADAVGGTQTTLTINELNQNGFLFVGATVATGGTQTQATNLTAANGAAGTFQVVLNANTTAQNQTLVTVTNRIAPGQIKVCKVAGPGVQQGTVFNFLVTGVPVNPATGLNVVGNNAVNGTVLNGGNGGGAIGVVGALVNSGFGAPNVTELLQIAAGPVGAPNCVLSQNRFQVGSNVLVNEVLTAQQQAAGIRLAQINSTSGFAGTTNTTNNAFATNGTTGAGITVTELGTFFDVLAGGFIPNAGTTAGGTATNFGGAVIPVRTQIGVVTFTNIGFAPAALKICKVAGAGVATGTPFTFNVTGSTLGGALATNTQTVTVFAGPASQGGFCTIVGGPFANQVAGGFGSFNLGSNITITETQTAGFITTNINSNTGATAGTTPNLGTGTITTPIFTQAAFNTTTGLIGTNANAGNIVEVTFVNAAAGTNPTPTPGTGGGGTTPTPTPGTGGGGNFVCPAGAVCTGGGGTTPARFDFDGDGKADIAVFRPSNGAWYLQNSKNGFTAVQFGQAGDKTVSADYDGDGKTDIAVYRSGTWYMLQSSKGFNTVQFGAAGDIAAPADTDGDFKSELTVYRPSNGTWYSLNLATNAFKAVQFGSDGDIPVAADYDGDGRTDYAVYRPSNGVWYMLQSTKGFGAIQFGNATDKPVVADYDNDGKADQAVYRAGTWYVMNSSKGLSVAQFGNATDSPVPADYDGDGKTDFAVYRDEKGAGMWYIMQSGGSGVTNAPSAPTLRAFQFGSATDMPIQTP